MRSFMREKSSNSVKVYWLEQDKLIRALKKTAQRIGKDDSNVSKIILFGSIAEKRGVPNSDADILILLVKDERKFPDRIPEWLEKMSVGFPVDVFPYTEDESKNPIVKEAMSKGMILYEK